MTKNLFQPADLVEGLSTSLKQLLGGISNIPQDAMEDINELARRSNKLIKGDQ
jgi:hypothetical protein